MTGTSRGGVGTARSGTLPETQVRAMFDRIAGVYDLMNSVMTAGSPSSWSGVRDLAGPLGTGRRSTWLGSWTNTTGLTSVRP